MFVLNSAIFLCVIGSDVVDWLYSHVEGFQDRREARKYACNLLKVSVVLGLCVWSRITLFLAVVYLRLNFVCICLFIRLVLFDTRLTRLRSQSSVIMFLAIFVEVSLCFSCLLV